jgi:hypothetical protein
MVRRCGRKPSGEEVSVSLGCYALEDYGQARQVSRITPYRLVPLQWHHGQRGTKCSAAPKYELVRT